ncbi:hypothetical protein JCM19231_2895 [Vibrio ishigakensis]|uniref:GlyGly-CTERM sorting domain-containing protein n=1 Tax=Vibrio ishigakensis TaxID=1481914 RepID=A0A0B8P2A3_9VIBR|nr:DUF3466 family protein [Vibrio ishigakensis]GAM57418.1 hypothetical protein JCM19231_2895 [Vibrio ishigakensis]
MKRSNIFKLSTVATLVTVSLGANASLYNVEMVSPSVTANEFYGSAISPADTLTATGGVEEKGTLAGDTRDGTDGFPFREEAPFGIDNNFYYLDWDDLESYCYRERGYNSCENWASREWNGINNAGGLQREREAFTQGYTSNARGFSGTSAIMLNPTSDYTPGDTSGGATPEADSNNVTVNKFSASGDVIGSTSSGYYNVNGNYGLAYRERGFIGNTILLPRQDGDNIVKLMGRTMAFDSFTYTGTDNVERTYVVGSAAVTPFNYNDGDKNYRGSVSSCFNDDDPGSLEACQNFAFSTKGYVWESTDPLSGLSVSTWPNTKDNDDTTGWRDDTSYMGSVRGAVVRDPSVDTSLSSTPYDEKPVLVGYNTYRDDNNLLMQAAVFYPKEGFSDVAADQWDTKFIRRVEVEQDGDYIYSNSKATDINNNLLVIGEAKRRGDKPSNGAANNRLFVADASEGEPEAIFLEDSGQSIFFNSAGGQAKAVNNHNEIVGVIDAESAREYNGKQRRQRGFIYPYSFEGTNAARAAKFQNKAWWLDDLTNDGQVDGNNNKFRIVAASDINEKGEISATALYCAEGYDNTGHNAYCGGGTGVEKVVAVKLVPTIDLDSEDDTVPVPAIEPRSVEQAPIERQGGSFGPWMLGLLGLVAWNRRRK